MREFKEQFGFVTIAQNTDINYLQLAYEQAKNIKATQKLHSYAVIVDSQTAEQITEEHRQVFDYVIVMPVDYAKEDEWKLSNEWQVFGLTPFKETIKLESDLLFTRDVGHWLSALRLRDVCFSLHCKDYCERTVTKTPYRKLFELNSLPDIYNGMFYFRFSQTSADFFRLARDIFTNWNAVKEQILHCDQLPTTDVVYAIAAKILGEELCTIPSLDWFNFVHMKPGVQKWDEQQPWTDHVNVEMDGSMLRINNINQYQPVHYHDKHLIIK